MASLSKSKKGTFSIQFVLHGNRKTIYAGKMEPREAKRLCEKVGELVGIQNRNARVEESENIYKWVSKIIGTKLHKKLVNVGLLKTIKETQLGAFIDDYNSSRTDVKDWTKKNRIGSKNRILKFFSPSTDLRSITPADAMKLKAFLIANYATGTAGKDLANAKLFFGHAVDLGLITKNPFSKLKIPNQANPKRLYFVDRATSQKVLDACPDLQSRLIFSMARFGGLRVPSELVGLKWKDVLWAEKKIRVPSPKTEHIPGKDYRWVPLFPEIMEPLRQAFEIAKEGDEFIFPRTITKKVNLRKSLLGIIKKAGLSPWPKLFQNLRASRETELCQDFPLHVAAGWIGNTPKVAIRHYLQTIDSDWEKATTISNVKSDVKSDVSVAKTMCFPMNQGGSQTFADVQYLMKNIEISSVLSTITEELQNNQVSPTGVEFELFLAEILKKTLKDTQKTTQIKQW